MVVVWCFLLPRLKRESCCHQNQLWFIVIQNKPFIVFFHDKNELKRGWGLSLLTLPICMQFLYTSFGNVAHTFGCVLNGF